MIGFIIIRMMDAKMIPQLLLITKTKLASIVISLADSSFQAFTKPMGILPISNATKPTRIFVARHGKGDTHKPVPIFRSCFTPLPSQFFSLRRPISSYLFSNLWAFTCWRIIMFPSSMGFRYLKPNGWGAFILHLLTQKLPMAILTSLRFCRNRSFTIYTLTRPSAPSQFSAFRATHSIRITTQWAMAILTEALWFFNANLMTIPAPSKFSLFVTGYTLFHSRYIILYNDHRM